MTWKYVLLTAAIVSFSVIAFTGPAAAGPTVVIDCPDYPVLDDGNDQDICTSLPGPTSFAKSAASGIAEEIAVEAINTVADDAVNKISNAISG